MRDQFIVFFTEGRHAACAERGDDFIMENGLADHFVICILKVVSFVELGARFILGFLRSTLLHPQIPIPPQILFVFLLLFFDDLNET